MTNKGCGASTKKPYVALISHPAQDVVPGGLLFLGQPKGSGGDEGTKEAILRKIVGFHPLFGYSRRKKILAIPTIFAYTQGTNVGESGLNSHEVGESAIFA